MSVGSTSLPYSLAFHFAWIMAVIWYEVFLFHFKGIISGTTEFAKTGMGLFNWHPQLAFVAVVCFASNAVMSYSAFPFNRLPRGGQKALHLALQFFAWLFMLLAVCAVWKFHNEFKPATHLTSMHSWFGIFVLTLYTIQLLGGIIAFVFPELSDERRAQASPLHIKAGVFIYTMAIVTALLGLMDNNGTGDGTTKINFGNSIGVWVTATGVLVVNHLLFASSGSGSGSQPLLGGENVI